eukprot:8545257-Pyramimonas_sp.AAC.1
MQVKGVTVSPHKGIFSDDAVLLVARMEYSQSGIFSVPGEEEGVYHMQVKRLGGRIELFE